MNRIRFETAQDVYDAFPGLAEVMTAPATDAPPLQFMATLPDSEAPLDAIAFCAYVLPRREAVGWLCSCLRMFPKTLIPPADPALTAAEAWVRDANESKRCDALELARASNQRLPSTWAAMAAGWSGGNLSLGAHPGAPAPADLTAKAARAGLALALATVPAQEWPMRIKACVEACARIATSDAR